MSIRKICVGGLILALLAVLGISVLSAAPAGTIKIGAIFAVTGPASTLGGPEERTARMVVDQWNKAGGINGQKVEIIIKDSAGSADKAISFAKQLIEEDNVVAIIGPTTSGESMAIKDICDKAKMPLISCAAAETIVAPVAKYVFKTPQKDSYIVSALYSHLKKVGITKIGVTVSNTGFGNGGKAQLEKYAPDFGITIVAAEIYDQTSTDLSAVLTKVASAGAQAIVNWSIEPAQAIIAKNMKQLKLTIPLFQSHGFGNIAFVEAAGEAAEGIVFPCGRLLIAGELPDSHPQKALLLKYAADYTALYKEQASTFGGHCYDALIILKAAIENAKSTDAVKLVDAISKIKNLAGTGGVFSFSDADHNGLGMDSIILVTVKDGKFRLLK